jgi:DNA mismatch repair protein MutS
MEIDKTTLNDLSIFDTEEEFSVFHKINRCKTSGGRDQLFHCFNNPLTTIEAITGVQQTLQTILQNEQYWPAQITNGTIMVIEKFYQSVIDEIPPRPSSFSAYTYKVFHNPDFSLVKYSAEHCFDFIKGMQLLVQHLLKEETPVPLKKILQEAKHIIDKEQFILIEQKESAKEWTPVETLGIAYFIRNHYKQNMLALLDIYFQLDAWYGMAQAVKQYSLIFPSFTNTSGPYFSAKGLYHILLADPVSYDITLNPEGNFLFLTGANMAGKSTFIKATGTAIFLAHLGMGVPSTTMQLSLFDGLLSNINVMDNISKGESFFYNEVQRIKATILKINNGKKWLILIDELFKGTNVEDAMRCSITVIKGLLKIKNALFILSTHLYEIGNELKEYPNINFNYFETTVNEGQLHFSYQLKEGISNDRLGYLILQKEGVTDLLDKL